MITLAKDGGTPCKTKPFHPWPYFNEREQELLEGVVKSGLWWRMSGDKVKTFEKMFAEIQGVEYCLGVTNGTHAIELALAALDIKAGAEVIVPAFTFISTLTAIIYSNAIPVIVDVDPETFCMDPTEFKKAITSKTKAVIPVHMAGHCCDMDAICDIAKTHDIRVIEDASHAQGAEWNGKRAGSFGDIGTFSFQNGKLVTCGEGGAIVTRSKELYERAYLIQGVGRPDGDRSYAHVLLGSNYRMNEFQGAILIAQLERLEVLNKKRETNAAILDRILSDIPGIIPQGRSQKANINTHYMYMFYYDAKQFNGLSRQAFVDYMIAEGIPAFIAYPVISNTKFYKEKNFRGFLCETVDLPEHDLTNATKIADEVVWLPHFTMLGDEQDLQEIANSIKKIQAYCNSSQE